MTLTIGSCFSGVGGLELGLEWAGLGPVLWQAERSSFCRRVLARHWPGVRRFEDVDDATTDAGCPDLICGGFPCQPFSTASRGRRVAEDAWPAFRRCVARFRPRWVVGENVARSAVDVAALDLAALGYTARTLEVPASLVGAPHDRVRWFVVAHADREAQPRQPEHAQMARVRAVPALGWQDDPGTVGLDDGFSNGVDRARRLHAAGNAVVPQVAEVIGYMIAELDQDGVAA